jgi:phosphoglycolate phosphatase
MKFIKYYKNNKIKEWRFFYIDYKKIKKVLKNKNNILYEIITRELNKLDIFINLINKYDNIDNEKVAKFLVINYMALFNCIKKQDKKLCKSIKIVFFKLIHSASFYKFYLNIPRKVSEVRLVIFDKDGTLINQNNIFGSWIIELVYNIPIVTNKDNLLIHLGYNKLKNKFNSNSVVAKGSNDDIKNSISEYISQNEKVLNTNNLLDYISKYWIEMVINEDNLVQCGNILDVFKQLKNKSIKIAICTSDDRSPTEKMVDILKLGDYIDYIICGDDNISTKPSPEPIWHICSNLNIDISSTVMVGDTISDMQAGINAKCGKVVGVLSGGYDSVELDMADNIVYSIDNIPEVLK